MVAVLAEAQRQAVEAADCLMAAVLAEAQPQVVVMLPEAADCAAVALSIKEGPRV